nr:leukotriene A-4 hydrolase isoform X4 [Crassostrea gigas]
MTDMNPDDSASFSRPDECRVTSLHLNLDVDFVSRTLCGFVDLAVKRMKDGVHNLILDAQMIPIKKILDVDYGQELKFTLGENSAIFGSKLEVQLPVSASKCHKIRVHYETSPQCPALQWLRPEQTLGKRHPYLFSQSQLRTKTNYMYGYCPHYRPFMPGAYFPVKIPQGIRSLTQQSIVGPRSKVWTEREMIEEAAYEFSETEKTLQIAESLMGPYIWGQYDVLVLPPIFPFGGMENPCLTYVTPTLIAGDKSLVDILAHEICHSWTGNLVTNKNWEHFWLNEGHTEFIERKVTGRLHNNKTLPQFMAAGKAVELKEIIEEVLKNGPYTRMIPDLKGVDPNDAFCIVPYEKGFTLLFYLETLLGGREVFEKFLRAYVENFKQQSIDSNQWKDFLYSYFHDKTEVLDSVEWEKWFYGQGMPPVMPKYDNSFAVPCKQLCQRWSTSADNDLDQFDSSDLTSMAPLQVVECLGLLVEDPPLSLIKIQKMNELYKLNVTKNSEFKFRWLRLCIKAQWKEAIPKVLEFINEQGRMRLVRTLYRDLYGWEDARPTAIDNFKKHRGEMHHILETMLSTDLKLG